MKIDKVTTKNGQAWVSFVSNEGTYMGTLHLIDKADLKVVEEKFRE